jgi:hypothetical protein
MSWDYTLKGSKRVISWAFSCFHAGDVQTKTAAICNKFNILSKILSKLPLEIRG